MTYGQRTWMTTHIAAGLRHLGIDVTPQTIETELKAMAGYTPPDPYAKGIDALRRDLPTRTYPAPQPPSATPTTYAPPDAYAKLKEIR